MTYKDKIEKHRREASLISVNKQMTIYQLDKMYRDSGVVLLCHDGKCVDMVMEEMR